MKILCISIAVLTLLVGTAGCSKPSITGPTPTPASPPSVASAIANTSPAVVRVITKTGMGSGMIIDKAGYVLTNSHVVEGNQTVSVVLSDGQELPASIIGRDEITDLAILRISSENLPVVTLGDSDKLEQAEEVIAIGYPLDLEGSATISRGIVSALRNYGGVDYIQSDTAINPGNSGGPLINLVGEVVGINVMTIRVVGGLPIEGMNFAIAINSAKQIIPKLIAGISILRPTPEPEPWLTYTNGPWGYLIQYPSTWKLRDNTSVQAGQVYIEGPGSAVITIRRIEALGTTVSHFVDLQINGNSEALPVYRVLSRMELAWQGIYPACEWTEVHQAGVGYPLLKAKHLYLNSNGYFYMVTGLAKESEYEIYSSTIDAIIASFRLIE